MNTSPKALILTGVAGCGKSTLGRYASEHLAFKFLEWDDLHSVANTQKIRAGVPLDDEDRWPWLQSIVEWIDQNHNIGNSCVVTCSALKKIYREFIKYNRPFVQIVFIEISKEAALDRVFYRRDHIFKPSLVDSQFFDLEIPSKEEGVIFLSAKEPVRDQYLKIKCAIQ